MFHALFLWLDRHLIHRDRASDDRQPREDYGKSGAEIAAEVREAVNRRKAEAREERPPKPRA
jgi:hypothetical protein